MVSKEELLHDGCDIRAPAAPPVSAAAAQRLSLPPSPSLQFDIPATYPTTAPEIELPELEGKTAKMYRGGKICLTIHFKPLWAKNRRVWTTALCTLCCASHFISHLAFSTNRPPPLTPLQPSFRRRARSVPGAGALAGGGGAFPGGVGHGAAQVIAALSPLQLVLELR